MIKKFIVFVCFTILVNSCELKTDCDANRKLNMSTECVAVVLVKPTYSRVFLEKGYNPYTNELCQCEENDRWMRNSFKEIDVGDTVLKKSGQLFYQIRKSDTVITYKFQCNSN